MQFGGGKRRFNAPLIIATYTPALIQLFVRFHKTIQRSIRVAGLVVKEIRQMNFGQVIRILVVDDDEDDLYLIACAINEVRETKYDITQAMSPLAAMASLAAETFDVILSDYRLGSMTGIDFINMVRAAHIDTPIILLTGVTDKVVDFAAQKAGASDFVPKAQIGSALLDRAIRYALANAERQRLLGAVLMSAGTGMAVLEKNGNLSLSNPRLAEFANAAFGNAPDRLQRLIDVAVSARSGDIVAGGMFLEVNSTTMAGGGKVLAFHDVTERVKDLRERQQAEVRMRKIAMQDALTGLPNRLAFNDHFDDVLRRSASKNAQAAVIVFSFNRFREVNECYGNLAGDQYLKEIALRLASRQTADFYPARLRGDEFAVIAEGVTAATALQLARALVNEIATPLKWNGSLISAPISCGVAAYPDHGGTRRELLNNADIAMYRAKTEVADPVRSFAAAMCEQPRPRRNLVEDLKMAMADDELVLHFQPQFKVATRELSGVEALLRWKSTIRGEFIPPDEFIPAAEESGLITDVDHWVLRQAVKFLVEWPDIPRVAINVSTRSICQAGFDNFVRSVIVNHGVATARIEFEVTETAIVKDLKSALHNLRQIKALGIAIALDDFGIGYSSLSLLNSFPFDRIKIDKSFVQSAEKGERAGDIFRLMVELGVKLRIPVLVEGVETQGQFDLAASVGSDEVQGYYLGRPVPAANVEAFASRSSPLHQLPRKAIMRQKLHV